MDNLNFLGNIEPAALEELYNKYSNDPSSVDIEWRKFFEGFDFAVKNYPAGKKGEIETSSEFKVINLITD